MKWINAEQQVSVTIYDEEHEEHLVKIMTVEEMLDTYTNEGCPTTYPSVESKIIKCKECMYCATDIDGELYCRKSACDIDENGSCSWAERRTDETDT